MWVLHRLSHVNFSLTLYNILDSVWKFSYKFKRIIYLYYFSIQIEWKLHGYRMRWMVKEHSEILRVFFYHYFFMSLTYMQWEFRLAKIFWKRLCQIKWNGTEIFFVVIWWSSLSQFLRYNLIILENIQGKFVCVKF